MGRVTLWLGGLSFARLALSWITISGSRLALSGWATFVTVLFALFALSLTSRWAWRHLTWRLRHRLIVTYIFIGVIPIVLLLPIAGIGSYLFAGQFATYIAISDLQSALQRLNAANDALAAQLTTLDRAGKLNEQIAGELISVSGEDFSWRTVTVQRGKQGFTLSAVGALVDTRPATLPDVVQGDFSGFLIDQDRLHLRAVKRYCKGGLRLTVISNVPVTPELLQGVTSRVGSVTLFAPDRDGDVQVPPPAKQALRRRAVPPRTR